MIHHLENTLDQAISIADMAKIACYSEFHFYRLFRTTVGESIYAFRKRLLLERAVRFLQYSDKSIIQIALESGYDSHSSFNKAFKKHFNHSPKEVRQKMIHLNQFDLTDNTYAGENMKIDIVTIDDIPVIATRGVGNYDEVATDAWGRIMKFAYANNHINAHVRRFGITHDDPNITAPNNIRYDACLDIDVDISTVDNLKRMVITGGKYARVLHKGSYDNLEKTYAYVFNHWLTQNDQQLRDCPCFDQYLDIDPRAMRAEDLTTLVHIPLLPKS